MEQTINYTEVLGMLKNRFAEVFGDKEKDLNQSIRKAHADMSRRAKGHVDEIRDVCAKYLAEEFSHLPSFKDQAEFDRWHKKVCDMFIIEFNSAARSASADIRGTYGRAQKVINMTFKYLACSDISERYKDALKFCHMTLDGYTLDWYKNEIIDWHNSLKKSDPTVKILKKADVSEWSKLNNYWEYKKIQRLIREYLKTKPSFSANIEAFGLDDLPAIPLPSTPFEAEFIVWEGTVARAKYRALIKAINDYFEKNDGKGGFEKDKWLIGSKFNEFLNNLDSQE